MTLSGPTKVLVILSTVAVWLSPAPVSAAFWILLDRTAGPSGTVVHGRTLGSGSVTLAPNQSLPIFLVEQDLASQIDDPADEGLVRLGELIVDANGDGTTTFTIPDVAAVHYDVLVHCEPCATSSAGATMLFGADLQVSSTPPGDRFNRCFELRRLASRCRSHRSRHLGRTAPLSQATCLNRA